MRAHLFLLFLLALLLLPEAQEPVITLEAATGFDGLYEDSAAIPLTVSIRNDGAPLDGEVQIITGNTPGDALVYSAPVSLPTGSNKRVPFVIHLPPFGAELAIRLLHEGQVIASTSGNRLRMVGREELLYGVVSSDPGSLAFLETVRGPRAGASVAFLAPADLPEVSSAWTALDVLVFHDTDTNRLSADQLAALRAWVEGGGLLVITGGPGGLQTASGVSELLPVAVSGVVSVDSLPGLEDFAGTPLDQAGPYLVATGRLLVGETLIGDENLPLLAVKPMGRGQVYFLALDPALAPLAGWSEQDRLWAGIAAAVPAPAPWGNGIRDGYAATQAVSYIPGLRMPSPLQLILYLFLYILVIGPINYLVLRRLKRLELAWATIPALVVLFSAAAILTGFRLRGNNPTLNSLSVAYGSIGSERVWTQTVLGLYTPRRSRTDLALPYDSTAFPLQEGFGSILGTSNLAAIERAGDLVLRDIRTDTSEVATFIVDAHLPRPPFSADATLSSGGGELSVTVRNEGANTLENAVILYGQQQHAMGNLLPGEEKEVTVIPGTAPPAVVGPTSPMFPAATLIPNPLINDPGALLGTSDYFSDPVAYPRWQLIQSLYGGETVAPARLPEPSEIVTLAGWLEGSEQAMSVSGDAEQMGVTLVLLEIPVR